MKKISLDWLDVAILVLAVISSIAALFDDGVELQLAAIQLMLVFVVSTLLRQRIESD